VDVATKVAATYLEVLQSAVRSKQRADIAYAVSRLHTLAVTEDLLRRVRLLDALRGVVALADDALLPPADTPALDPKHRAAALAADARRVIAKWRAAIMGGAGSSGGGASTGAAATPAASSAPPPPVGGAPVRQPSLPPPSAPPSAVVASLVSGMRSADAPPPAPAATPAAPPTRGAADAVGGDVGSAFLQVLGGAHPAVRSATARRLARHAAAAVTGAGATLPPHRVAAAALLYLQFMEGAASMVSAACSGLTGDAEGVVRVGARRVLAAAARGLEGAAAEVAGEDSEVHGRRVRADLLALADCAPHRTPFSEFAAGAGESGGSGGSSSSRGARVMIGEEAAAAARCTVPPPTVASAYDRIVSATKTALSLLRDAARGVGAASPQAPSPPPPPTPPSTADTPPAALLALAAEVTAPLDTPSQTLGAATLVAAVADWVDARRGKHVA